MLGILNAPLLLLAAAVFVGILVAIVLFDRLKRGSQQGNHVLDYINVEASSDPSIDLTSRLRQNSSGFERLLAFAAVSAPHKLRATVASDLEKARSKLSPNMFLGIRVVLLVGGGLVAGLWLLSIPEKGVTQWGIAGGALMLAVRLPTMWLKRRIKNNKRAIEHSIPYALDLMVACLEGGLSLEATLDKVAGDSDTLLAEEIRRTMAEIALGRPSSEALRELGNRTGAQDLKRLTETVVQADRMGISIAEAMRMLAEDARARRRQHAEEQARKAPVKMLPVLVLCTLPAIAAIFLTPAMISIGRAASVFHR